MAAFGSHEREASLTRIPRHRVVITGLGVLSPLGLSMEETWDGLIAGRNGIGPITLFDASRCATRIAGELKDFDARNYTSHKEARHMDRFAQIAVAASRQALEQSGLIIGAENQCNIGIVVGSGIGGLTTLFEQAKVLAEKGPDRVNPFLIPMMIADIAAAQVSIVLGIKGPNLCTTSACSSGADAIGVANEVIRRGDARVMLAGGSEAIINEMGIAAFNACKALSTRRNDEPKLASRPFDAERDGFIIGEGAGILVLEDLEHAQERGAEILAEIVGYGASADAYHITQPMATGDGAIRAMEMALEKAAIKSSQIDYINAHGTSTLLNDRMETRAIKSTFGDYAYKVPISSTKSQIGHLIGGAGAVEAAISVMTILRGVIPATMNLIYPDPECDLDYVPNVPRHANVKTVLSNSFGFGGHNSSLVFKRFREQV